MRIALVSYEFAGVAQGGGIGTYIRNAAMMLSKRGHEVHVVTSSTKLNNEDDDLPFSVHTCPVERRQDFAVAAADVFDDLARSVDFDIVEGPEYNADASVIRERHPLVPLVVKLHAPTFTINRSNARNVPVKLKARYYAGSILRGKFPSNPWRYSSKEDPERRHALEANLVVGNSQATSELVGRVWNIPPDRLDIVRYPFAPPEGLLRISPEAGREVVLFVGRLEVRKGVLDLARAIPHVIAKRPKVRFRFVGQDQPHPSNRELISNHILRLAGNARHAIDMVGALPYDNVPDAYAGASIAVFPSEWEASGFVCMEAMAAARGVIGSSCGGMAEIIEDRRSGLLVPPHSPQAIAKAILTLLMDPEYRMKIGRAARQRILSEYAPEVVGPLQEASYKRAIAGARQRANKPVLME